MSMLDYVLDEHLTKVFGEDWKENYNIRVLSGHSRIVKNTYDATWINSTFVDDANPNYRWFSSQSGGNPDWMFKPGSSFLVGRKLELQNYRSLLENADSGFVGVFQNPRHIPSFGLSVEVWGKGFEMSPLLEWQQSLSMEQIAAEISVSLSISDDGRRLLWSGTHTMVDFEKSKCRANWHDNRTDCIGLFALPKGTWRKWDTALFSEAMENSKCRLDEKTITDQIKTRLRLKEDDEMPKQWSTDSEMLAEFPSGKFKFDPDNELGNPYIALVNREKAAFMKKTDVKSLVVFWRAEGGQTTNKLFMFLNKKNIKRNSEMKDPYYN